MRTVSYKKGLISRLQNDDYAVKYLTAVLAEETMESFLIALDDVIKARKASITSLSKKTGLTRQGIYKALQKNGNPEFFTITKVLKSMGLNLAVVSKKIA